MTKIYSESEEQTELFAQKIAGKLMPGAILILNGEMGSGKSVFARGIIHGLGYSGTVTSPTFTLMNTYEGGLLPFIILTCTASTPLNSYMTLDMMNFYTAAAFPS